MKVHLTAELEQLVQSKVKSGRYHSASEVVRETLRLLEERDQLLELRKEAIRRKIDYACLTTNVVNRRSRLMNSNGRWLSLVLVLSFTALGLGACALSNEGAVDYRKAASSTPKERQDATAPPADGQNATTPPGHTTTPPQPKPSTRVPLIRKDVANLDAVISKNDKITIRLRDAFLSTCNEILRNPFRKFRKNCEIGIIFKAFELGDGDFDFSPNSIRDGRLVYYSHDVQPGQYLNLHNMPVYGPLDFHGKPIGIDIFITETDAEDNQTQALLKTLANAGATVYPPAQAALGILDKLGGALLKGNTDDIEFRYTMVLDPSGGYTGMAYPITEAGNYVLIREHDRLKSTPWDTLWLDDNTGRVHIGKDGPLYRDNTYITMQINRNAGTEDVQLAQNTYGAFRDALEKDQTQQAEALETALIPTLTALAIQRVQIRNFSDIRKLLEDITGAAKAYRETDPEKKQEPSSSVERSAFEFHGLLQRSVIAITKQVKQDISLPLGASCVSLPREAQDNSSLQSDLSAEQVDYLLGKLSEVVEAKTTDDQATFSCDKNQGFGMLDYKTFRDKLFPN